MTQDVRLIGRNDARFDAGLPCFRSGIMMAFLHICGRSPLLSDKLKISRSSLIAFSPRFFRNEGGMLSGPGAPFFLIFLIARFSSAIVYGGMSS